MVCRSKEGWAAKAAWWVDEPVDRSDLLLMLGGSRMRRRGECVISDLKNTSPKKVDILWSEYQSLRQTSVCSYDQNTQILEVEFKNGTVYQYTDVSLGEYEADGCRFKELS